MPRPIARKACDSSRPTKRVGSPAASRNWIKLRKKRWRDFREALKRYPRSRRALRNIAHVLAERVGKTDDAIAVLDSLLALDSRDPVALASRGVLHARLGHRDAAVHDAEAALAIARNENTLYQVACIYALTSQHRPDDANHGLTLLREAMAQQPRVAGRAMTDADLKLLRNRREFRSMTMGAALLLKPRKRPK